MNNGWFQKIVRLFGKGFGLNLEGKQYSDVCQTAVFA
jgi:hypothetical protein